MSLRAQMSCLYNLMSQERFILQSQRTSMGIF